MRAAVKAALPKTENLPAVHGGLCDSRTVDADNVPGCSSGVTYRQLRVSCADRHTVVDPAFLGALSTKLQTGCIL